MSGSGHLVLVGLMGSGKSTTGRALAERLGRPFVDLDAEIEKSESRTISEIFSSDGEQAFRDLESRHLARVLGEPDGAVIAAGGGAVLAPANRAMLSLHTVVWLRCDPGVLAGRVGDGEGRPLLGGDPHGRLAALAADRASLYAGVADYVVDVDDLQPAQIVEEIVRMTGFSG